MKKTLQGFVETLSIFGLALAVCGSIGAAATGYLVLADQYGPLWPSVGLGIIYLFCCLLAYLRAKVVKKPNEVPSVGSDNPTTTGRSGVVKLDDTTVATAVREAQRKHYGPHYRP